MINGKQDTFSSSLDGVSVTYSSFLIPPMFVSQPITVALVYAGTTLKDLSDVTHGWGEFSKSRWVRDAILSYIY